MDIGMLDAAFQALLLILEPHRLVYVALGVVLGLVLGILPGIGGLAGTALLIPFTFAMDPYTAFAFLLGLGAVTATGDPIPAIMFGVPGGAGSAATVLDGLPMAKRGEAGRALSAAYMSSLLGGLFGSFERTSIVDNRPFHSSYVPAQSAWERAMQTWLAQIRLLGACRPELHHIHGPGRVGWRR